VSCSIPRWKAGEWHHLACVWNLNAGGKAELAIYLDGRKRSNAVIGRKKKNSSPMQMQPILQPVQLGSLNSGQRVALVALDEVRIWPEVHYHENFTPIKAAMPAPGALYFSFDNGLTGYFGTGDTKQKISAVIGAQN